MRKVYRGNNHCGQYTQRFTYNKAYDVEVTPTLIDPVTLDPFFQYLVRNDRGELQVLTIDNFVDVSELREEKLNELGI